MENDRLEGFDAEGNLVLVLDAVLNTFVVSTDGNKAYITVEKRRKISPGARIAKITMNGVVDFKLNNLVLNFDKVINGHRIIALLKE